MATSPRLTLCIPTFNRAGLLPVVLESALREAASLPEGVVEILVSDNGSTDATPAVVEAFRERWPALRSLRFPENRAFDANYMNCMENARGDYVWIMGDDDAWMEGAARRVLLELEDGADALLCAALECDMEMRPLGTRGWFEDPAAPRTWDLRTREDLAAYFDALRFQAGAFAFISAAVIRRERFLSNAPWFKPLGMGFHYIHVWGMVAFLLSPAVIRWVPEPLLLNRLGNDPQAHADPWARGITDLHVWKVIGDTLLADDPRLRAAFNGVLRRNHQDIMVRRMRMGAADNAGRWTFAREVLLAAGFDPLWVEASDFLYRLYMLEVPLSPKLRPEGLCLADLPLAALGARTAVVLAPGDSLAEASGLLDALRECGRFDAIRVVCDPGGAALLDGFDVQEADPVAFAADRAFQERWLAELQAFRPGLLVNADRSRGLAGDLMAARAQAPAALAFQGRAEGLSDELFVVLDRAYALRLPADAPDGALERALGLAPGRRRLWPAEASRQEAADILQGWTGTRTLALCGDGGLEAPELAQALARRMAEGWTAVGVGGRGSFRALDTLLAPYGERAMNLGEALETGTLAALLALCAEHLGGGGAARLAVAAGCPPHGPVCGRTEE